MHAGRPALAMNAKFNSCVWKLAPPSNKFDITGVTLALARTLLRLAVRYLCQQAVQCMHRCISASDMMCLGSGHKLSWSTKHE